MNTVEMNHECDLIKVTKTKNAYGVLESNETSRTVFCGVSSIGAKEFFDAGRNGLNPELRFKVPSADYEGEQIVSYNGKRYRVYRTYEDRDQIELYTQRRGGDIYGRSE